MSNEIGQIRSVEALKPPERERGSRLADEATQTAQQHGKGHKGETDEVELSSSALQMREMAKRLVQDTGIDPVRVKAIRERLDRGAYPIEAGRLADAILKQELLFAFGGDR